MEVYKNKELLENAIVDYVDEMIEIGDIELKDNDDESQIFSLVKIPEKINRIYDIDIETIILSYKKQKCKLVGYVNEWHDTQNELPNYLKNKDNIVTKPDSYEQLEEYQIFDNTYLKEGIYREYIFLEDHGNLQKTYNVNAIYK